MRNHPLKFFYQREMEDQRDEEAQPVGPRAGSESRAINYCSLREITQSIACHVCDMGALDRDKSLLTESWWKKSLEEGCLPLMTPSGQTTSK